MNRCCSFASFDIRAFKFFAIIILLLGCTFGLIPMSQGMSSHPNVWDFDDDGVQDWADCDPADPNNFPGGNDAYGDGEDNNCDGADGFDFDGDNSARNVPTLDRSIYPTERDCNDDDNRVHGHRASSGTSNPFGPYGDGFDNNCNGID